MNIQHSEMEKIDLSYMDLIIDGDAEMKKEMLFILLNEPQEEIAALWQKVEDNDCEGIKKICHKMKATLAFVGNERLSNINFEINQMAGSNTITEELIALLSNFESLFQKLLIQVKAEYEKL